MESKANIITIAIAHIIKRKWDKPGRGSLAIPTTPLNLLRKMQIQKTIQEPIIKFLRILDIIWKNHRNSFSNIIIIRKRNKFASWKVHRADFKWTLRPLFNWIKRRGICLRTLTICLELSANWRKNTGIRRGIGICLQWNYYLGRRSKRNIILSH